MDKIDEYNSQKNKKGIWFVPCSKMKIFEIFVEMVIVFHIVYFFSTEIDHIIGCGQRLGMKYFLVRFKGAQENEIIDWNAAKEFAVQVMEFFGSRLKWSSLDEIVDEDVDVDSASNQQRTDDSERNRNVASTSLLDDPINEIQFAQ